MARVKNSVATRARRKKILKRAGRHALFLQPRGVWSGSGVSDQNGKDVIFAL